MSELPTTRNLSMSDSPCYQYLRIVVAETPTLREALALIPLDYDGALSLRRLPRRGAQVTGLVSRMAARGVVMAVGRNGDVATALATARTFSRVRFKVRF